MSNRFESLVNKLPVSWERMLSSGMSFFLNDQDPEHVEFEKAQNGYLIKVITDEENAKDACDFWVEHVEPKLDGNNDQ